MAHCVCLNVSYDRLGEIVQGHPPRLCGPKMEAQDRLVGPAAVPRTAWLRGARPRSVHRRPQRRVVPPLDSPRHHDAPSLSEYRQDPGRLAKRPLPPTSPRLYLDDRLPGATIAKPQAPSRGFGTDLGQAPAPRRSRPIPKTSGGSRLELSLAAPGAKWLKRNSAATRPEAPKDFVRRHPTRTLSVLDPARALAATMSFTQRWQWPTS